MCTGSFVFASAGLLEGRRCSVHWYHYQDFKKRFPGALPVIDELFVEDRGVITSPGGAAATDLALHLVEKYFGAERVMKVLRHMILDWNRPIDHPQTPYMKDYQDIIDPRVRRAVFFMEQNITAPISGDQAAEEAGVSTRQLERLFQIFLRDSPAGYFRKLRLRHANWLLHNTRKSITDIALECGFSDSSHFAKRYKDFFGGPPGRARGDRR
ncbi:MAG: helix-turn-helix domain-containing protein [Candidatus Adiutrix sp.]|nr:helix-turn-helix domain-containing protein [Candidatus Adiutrix sp.]